MATPRGEIQFKSIYAPLPNTERGKPTLLNGDPKGENVLYCCGSSVVTRNIKEPRLGELYAEHQHAPTVAKYSPSRYYIASGDQSGMIRVWDTTQAEHILKIELRPLSGRVMDIAWSPDNQRLCVVGEGRESFGAVFIWDSGASTGSITGHSKAITSCDFKPSRPFRVITGSDDNQVNWFQGPPFKFQFSHKHHTRFINCVRFSPDGSLAISVGQDKQGFFYDGKSGEAKHTLQGGKDAHKGGIYQVSWSSDGKQLLTASGDKSAKIWDVETGTPVTTFTVGKEVLDQQLGCLWQNQDLLSLSYSGDLNYLDPNSGTISRVVQGHNKFTTAVTYDANTKSIYSGSYDARLVRWQEDDASTHAIAGKGHANQIVQAVVHGDKLVTTAMDDSVRFTPLNAENYDDSQAASLDSLPAGVAAVPSDTSLVVAAARDSVSVLRDGKVVHTTKIDYEASAIAVSADGTEVAVGSKTDYGLYLYALNGDALNQTHKLTVHRGAVLTIAYSPDGQHIASGDAKNDIVVWDAAARTARFSGQWCFHRSRVNAIAWSPDSLKLASGSLDQDIIVWKIQDPAHHATLKRAHHGGVNDVQWIDNETILSVGQDSSIKTFTYKA